MHWYCCHLLHLGTENHCGEVKRNADCKNDLSGDRHGLGSSFYPADNARQKEDWRIEGVPEKEFSDKELWAAGFAMQQMPMFSMDSAVGKKMMSASAILHPENGGRFVEYWARLYWARTLSMSLLVLALAFCAAVFMDGYMLFAVLVAVLPWWQLFIPTAQMR